MQRALLVLILVSIMLGACTQRMVCPAYQSAFIYDKDQLRKKFSYFQEDSTPKILTASRNKYLVADAQPYKKRVRNLQTVQMRPVFVVVPDSLKPEDQREETEEGMDGEDGVDPGDELDAAARSVIDSTFIVDVPQDEPKPAEEDSVYMISKDKELRLLKYNTPDSLILDASTGKYVPQKPRYAVVNVTFNVEQDNYMWYLRDYLVLPDVRLARNRQGNEGESEGEDGTSGKKSKKKKGIKGFFRNLFGKDKKDKGEAEKPAVEEAPKPVDEEETFDYVDEDEQAVAPATTPKPDEEPAKKERKKKEKKPKEDKPKKKKKTETEETPPPLEDEAPPPAEEPRDEDSF
jgi:hypothetical protein